MSPIFQYAADLYRDMRQDWDAYLESEHAKAEEGSHGSMLNSLGRREGIDPYSLLTGPWSRVIRYAAPELVEWFESHGRPSPSQFEREWFIAWLGEEPLPVAELAQCSDPQNHSHPCACAAPVTWTGPELPQSPRRHKADC